jgi:hypothetical protein
MGPQCRRTSKLILLAISSIEVGSPIPPGTPWPLARSSLTICDPGEIEEDWFSGVGAGTQSKGLVGGETTSLVNGSCEAFLRLLPVRFGNVIFKTIFCVEVL